MICCKSATRRAALLSAVLAAVLAGCAAPIPVKPEAAVRERAKERWQALLGGNTEKAYNMMAPGYRAVTSLNSYRSGMGGSVQWVGAEVVAVNCETEKCTARLRVDARPMIGMRQGGVISTHLDETWVLESGQWWFFQKL